MTELSVFERDVLEAAFVLAKEPGTRFQIITECKNEENSIYKLADLGLIEVRTISYARNRQLRAYLLESTVKGHDEMKSRFK